MAHGRSQCGPWRRSVKLIGEACYLALPRAIPCNGIHILPPQKQWISTVRVRDPPLSAFAFGLQQSVSLLQQFAPMGIILAHIFKAACQHLDCLTVQAVFMKQR